MQLENRVALVTGASSGIGAAVARELSGAGMKTLLTARRGDCLREICSLLTAAEFVAADMEAPDTPQRILDATLECFGRCDVVVNNAGIIETGEIDEIDLDRVSRMIRLNVEAAVRMAYLSLRHFRRAGTGHLVNMSSVLGTKVRPAAGAYAATKHALEALSEALRMELAGSGVQVTCIQPGLVLTELHDHMEIHPSRSMGVRKPLSPEDVAQAVRFVLTRPSHVRIPRLMVLPGENQI